MDVFERLREKKNIITVINKSDLPHVLSEKSINRAFKCNNAIMVSALFGHGIDSIRQAISNLANDNRVNVNEALVISNIRHKKALEQTKKSLELVSDGLNRELSPELIAVDLQAALSSLGEITGETAAEDILDIIFSKFCIGK